MKLMGEEPVKKVKLKFIQKREKRDTGGNSSYQKKIKIQAKKKEILTNNLGLDQNKREV